MDPDRFDTLIRSLSAVRSRRQTLLTTLGAALGTLRLGASDDALAAKSGKCARLPGECETCTKGKCQRKNGKKSCKAGKIQSKVDATACAGGSCQNGQCISPTGQAVSPPPPGCEPEPEAITCANRCGEQRNNCNQPVSCSCPSGQDCLVNGTCARQCTDLAHCVECSGAGTLGCAFRSVEEPQYCIASANLACNNFPLCSDTAECPTGTICTGCFEPFGATLRCKEAAVCPS
jgi:hypothetical protein